MNLYEFREVRYDPIKCARWLHTESKGKINEWIADQDTYETQELLIQVTRKVFKLPEYHHESATGYTDEYVLDLLEDFTSYLAKKPSRGSTSPP